MTLFERIKEVSKMKGFALSEVAKRANIGEKSIYTWKPSKAYPNGIEPKRETLEKVADVLGVSVDYLLGNTDEMHTATYDPKYDPQTVKVINKIEKTGLNKKQLEVLDSYIDFLKTQFIEDMKKDDEN